MTFLAARLVSACLPTLFEVLKMKFSKRVRNNKTYVTVHGDFDYNTLVAALRGKFPSVRITSGGSYTSVTGVVE